LTVFVLQHAHEFEDGSESVSFIGVYSTRRKARAAVARLAKQPGFCDLPQGFNMDEYEVDQDHWTEGYVTIYPERPKRKTPQTKPGLEPGLESDR